MYVTIIQNNPKLGALRENAESIIASIDALAESAYPPDLVIFPAYALTGATVRGMRYYEPFAVETWDAAHHVMVNAKLPTLLGTMFPKRSTGENPYFCEAEALFCKGGKGKALGFSVNAGKWGVIDSDLASVSFNFSGNRLSVVLDDYPCPLENYSEADILIVLLAMDYHGTENMFTASGKLSYFRKIAQKNKVWLIVANLAGAQDENVFSGASFVLRPDGSVAQALLPFEEGSMNCNINLNEEVKKVTSGQGPKYNDSQIVRPLLPYEAEWKALKVFIRDYVRKNGFTDVVLGLSGGLDSAVCAALACDALGAEHVHGILMPSPYSSQGSIDDSLLLAQNLGIETITMPVDEGLKAMLSVLEAVLGPTDSPIAQQNIQNRIRMTLLMYMSNCFDWLLLSTSNKSELAVGYSTLYGDSVGALAPLGNTYKSDVYGLADWRNEQSRVIPQSIITKVPSAELYEGQTDEDTLPPYSILDSVLRLHIEEGLGVDQILEFISRTPDKDIIASDMIESILRMVKQAEFKRRHRPRMPEFGTVNMNIERNWPVTNAFTDHRCGSQQEKSLMHFLSMAKNWREPGSWDFLAN